MYQIKKVFLNFLLMLKNIFAKKSKNEKAETVFTSGSRKSAIGQAASLDIKNKNQELINKVQNESKELVKQYYGDTDKTLELIKSKNIRVCRIPNAKKILGYINEKPGFIAPLRNGKAIFLNFVLSFLCDKKLVFKKTSDAVFVFSKKDIDKFYLASQIYKFIAYSNNLPGFEYSEQEKFKKLYSKPDTAAFDRLTAGDIFAIKEVIARESEAADFALSLNQEEQA
ncbi:MAG: hypothetical protein K6C94_03415 [Candidatus Gastranaerophilales bacterium]|nr:hypothetical protein [Candidatus Gastranaerophilales bacterium]